MASADQTAGRDHQAAGADQDTGFSASSDSSEAVVKDRGLMNNAKLRAEAMCDEPETAIWGHIWGHELKMTSHYLL